MEKSKEKLEKEKLQAEIDQLSKPFYLKPAFLSIISSSLFAAITIFVTLRISTSDKLAKIDKRELDIRTRELQIKEDSLKSSLQQLELKIENLDNVFESKNNSLDRRFEQKSDSLDNLFFVRLKEIQGELKYIEKYMGDYAKGYSYSFVHKRKSTRDTIKKYVPNFQLQFANWLEKSMAEAIRTSNSKTLQKVDLKADLEEFKLKN